jgi:hypothetical protein
VIVGTRRHGHKIDPVLNRPVIVDERIEKVSGSSTLYGNSVDTERSRSFIVVIVYVSAIWRWHRSISSDAGNLDNGPPTGRNFAYRARMPFVAIKEDPSPVA